MKCDTCKRINVYGKTTCPSCLNHMGDESINDLSTDSEIRRDIEREEREVAVDFILDSLINLMMKIGNVEVNRDGEDKPVMLEDVIDDLQEIL